MKFHNRLYDNTRSYLGIWNCVSWKSFWSFFPAAGTYSTVAKRIHSFASVWYTIGLHWPNIKPCKSHTTIMGFWLQTDMNKIFQIRHCSFLWVKRLQKIFEVKVGGRKENCQLSQSLTQCSQGQPNQQILYRPPTLTFDIFAASWPTRMHSTSFERYNSDLFGAWSPRLWYNF